MDIGGRAAKRRARTAAMIPSAMSPSTGARRLSLRAFALIALFAAPMAHGADAQAPTPAPIPYGKRADVRAFADEVAASTGLPRHEVERWLAAAKFQRKIVAAMDRPLLLPPKWFEYSPRLVA